MKKINDRMKRVVLIIISLSLSLFLGCNTQTVAPADVKAASLNTASVNVVNDCNYKQIKPAPLPVKTPSSQHLNHALTFNCNASSPCPVQCEKSNSDEDIDMLFFKLKEKLLTSSEDKWIKYLTIIISVVGFFWVGYGFIATYLTRNDSQEAIRSAKEELKKSLQDVNSKWLEVKDDFIKEQQNLDQKHEELKSKMLDKLKEVLEEDIVRVEQQSLVRLEKRFRQFLEDQVRLQNTLHHIRSHLWERAIQGVPEYCHVDIQYNSDNYRKINIIPSGILEQVSLCGDVRLKRNVADGFREAMIFLQKQERMLNQLLSSEPKILCDGIGYFEQAFRHAQSLPPAWKDLFSQLYRMGRLRDPNVNDMTLALLKRHFQMQSLSEFNQTQERR